MLRGNFGVFDIILRVIPVPQTSKILITKHEISPQMLLNRPLNNMKATWKKLILLKIILLIVASECESTSLNNDNSSLYRLPSNIIPTTYDLFIRTRLNNDTYDGETWIQLRILEKTMRIVLHVKDLLVFREKTVLLKEKQLIPIKNQSHHLETQFYVIDVFNELKEGEDYLLKVFFSGKIQDDVFGFYKSSYVDANGMKKWIALTQFSPTYARRAFPCMDEPYLKAVFIIRLEHHRNTTVTSNTPIEKNLETTDNYLLTTFHPTPRMPTYLIGWTTHEFIPETSKTMNNFTIWTRDTMTDRGSFIINQGPLIYKILKGWISLENPIRKMDHFAIPDFHFNAMENWGMMTFRESVGLFENHTTPFATVIRGLTTLTHEYAHTWFGNLVTPTFWDVAWLKEGFSTYFQYYGMDLFSPTWKMMDLFVVDIIQPTMLDDSGNHSRTLNGRSVGSPNSILAAMDYITYKKGASIIHMIRHTIGEQIFQQGLRNYLKNMSYESAIPSDLYRNFQNTWDTIEPSHENISIADFIESWTNEVGYPLISIRRDYNNRSIEIIQERFYKNYNTLNRTSSDEYEWWIPLTYTWVSSKFIKTKLWLKSPRVTITSMEGGKNLPIIFNVQRSGYYRVNYDEINWNLLVHQLKFGNLNSIHHIDRAVLIDDAFNLARAGYIDYKLPFNMSFYLINETEYEPWITAIKNLEFLNGMLLTEPGAHAKFQNYAIKLMSSIYKKLNFIENPDENIRTKLFRNLILSTMCSMNDKHCLETSDRLFESWIDAKYPNILADLKSLIYCIGIKLGNETRWDRVWDLFVRSDLHTEQELLLNGLGCTREPTLIQRYLNLSIAPDSPIRKQYRITGINSLLNDDHLEKLLYILEFFDSHLKEVMNWQGEIFSSKILILIGEKIKTETQLVKFRSLVNNNIELLAPIKDSVDRAIAIAEENLRWIRDYVSVIGKLFDDT